MNEEVKSVEPETIAEEPTKQVVKKSRFKRFKSFAKTKRGKIVLGVSSIFVLTLVIGGAILILNNKNAEPNVVIAENIASDKIYDNYDFIYNSGDSKLVASTADRVKQLDIISGEDKIVDYIISPDKRKITYSLSDKDYKSKITSPNADLTKFKFEPVAFKAYELNLETGENKLIWSTDKIELKKTEQRLYNTKKVVYPDSYVVDWYYQYGISYPVSYTYPVSYIEEVDDVEAGYNTKFLPWDLTRDLRNKAMHLIAYKSDGSAILMEQGDELIFYDIATSSTSKIPISEFSKDCAGHSGKWISNIITVESECPSGERLEKIFILENGKLRDLYKQMNLSHNLHTQLSNEDFALVSEYFQYEYYYGYKGYAYQQKPNISVLDYKNRTISKVLDLKNTYDVFEQELAESVETIGSDEHYTAVSKATNENESGEKEYTLYKYNPDKKELAAVATMILPSDIYNFIYNAANNTFSYYRKYKASTETIIEYKLMNLETKEEKELVNIKVDNDSVLYYKPKLIWLDLE